MFKAMGHLARFADGLGFNDAVVVNSSSYWYVLDICGGKHIGRARLDSHNATLQIEDINSSKLLEFEGDYFPTGQHQNFIWFPSINHAAVLHDSYENLPTKPTYFRDDLVNFIHSEMILEISKNGSCIGEKSRQKLHDDASKYANSFELIYGALLKQKDFMQFFKRFNYDPLFLSDPEIRVDENVGIYHFSNKETIKALIMASGIRDEPEQLFQYFLDHFRSYFTHAEDEFVTAYFDKSKIEQIRMDNPKSSLAEKVKTVDTSIPYRIPYFDDNQTALTELNRAAKVD